MSTPADTAVGDAVQKKSRPGRVQLVLMQEERWSMTRITPASRQEQRTLRVARQLPGMQQATASVPISTSADGSFGPVRTCSLGGNMSRTSCLPRLSRNPSMAEHSDRRSPYDLEPRWTKLVSAMYLDDTSWGVAGRVVGEEQRRAAASHTLAHHAETHHVAGWQLSEPSCIAGFASRMLCTGASADGCEVRAGSSSIPS